MSAEERDACLELGGNLERAWTHEGVTPEVRKRIVRAALEEIMVRVEEDRVRLLLHWRGGDHTEVFVGKRATGRHRYTTDAETETLVTGLARQMPDMAIAALLNRLGRRTGKGNSLERVECPQFPPQTRHPGLPGKASGGRATK